VARLRAAGLMPAEIGRRLGVSRQRVGQILRALDRARSRSLACRACGASAAAAGAAPTDVAGVLCLGCLWRRPDAPFAHRLRSCRAAAGLSREELARRTGLSAALIKGYEAGRRQPQWRHIMPLVRELGVALVTSDPGASRAPPVPQPYPA
jgi:transcriptional regulator with XRE-family HTH domain